MNRFLNILGEIPNIKEEDNDDLDMLYVAIKKMRENRITRNL